MVTALVWRAAVQRVLEPLRTPVDTVGSLDEFLLRADGLSGSITPQGGVIDAALVAGLDILVSVLRGDSNWKRHFQPDVGGRPVSAEVCVRMGGVSCVCVCVWSEL